MGRRYRTGWRWSRDKPVRAGGTLPQSQLRHVLWELCTKTKLSSLSQGGFVIHSHVLQSVSDNLPKCLRLVMFLGSIFAS